MDTTFTLCLSNEKIWNFYNNHPNLNFEEANLIFIDIMNKLMYDASNSLNSNLASNLIASIKAIQTQVSSITENISREFVYKLSESKREYIEDIKVILTNNISERIAPLIREQNSIVLDKTNLLINDFLSKNKDETIVKQVEDTMREIQSSISTETNKLLSETITQKTFTEFVANIESKFITNDQSSRALFNSTEQRLDTSIKDIKYSTENQLSYLKEISTSSHQVNSALNSNISEILKKMEGSSTKGKMSENILFNILHSLYPCSQIDSVGTQKETGDIMIIRNNKPVILIENKNWNRNVAQDEVAKFIHDVENQNCCGLFLAQNHGIANKENFEININNGNVLLYVHEVNNDSEKIRIAISIIDHFKSKLDEIDNKSEIDTISKDLLEDINKEYQNFISQKINMIKLIKDCNQKMLKQIDEFQIPTLDNYLSTRYAFAVSKFICEYCQYNAKNHQAISAHQRGCVIKRQHDLANSNNSTDSNAISDSNIIIKAPKKDKKTKRKNTSITNKEINIDTNQ
jgi:hypothetical protein